MKKQVQIPVDDDAQLKSRGEILVDRKAMERKIDDELAKIVNEQMIKFDAYLRSSAMKFTTLICSLLVAGVLLWFAPAVLCPIIFFGIFVTLCMLALFQGLADSVELVLSSCVDIFRSLRKKRRARKLFAKISRGLRASVLMGRCDITSLRTKFHARLESRSDVASARLRKLVRHREDLRKQLIEQAKESPYC
ncbi:MAG: hypothetical protein KGI60_04425 [Patescibacteria group bacterium]|nr:hypothetical protein [Patescibacteria group bacterium]